MIVRRRAPVGHQSPQPQLENGTLTVKTGPLLLTVDKAEPFS